jgi:molybdopterin/thiamine biosynthesis adenylyltransferase
MVELHVSEESVDSQPEDYFQQFDVVILTDQKYDSICRVNKICRLHNIK